MLDIAMCQLRTYVLDGNKVWSDEGNVVVFLEVLDYAGMIDSWDEDSKKVGEQGWLLLHVE